MFNRSIFPEFVPMLGYTILGQSPKVHFWELLWQNFYRPDAFPETASKHWMMAVLPRWGQKHNDGYEVAYKIRITRITEMLN